MSPTPDEAQPPARTVVIGDETYVIGGATVAEQDAREAELKADVLRRIARGDVGNRVDSATALARDVGWDWLEQYGDPIVLNMQWISNQIQNAGVAWGGLTALQRAEALRRGMSYTFAILIRFSQGLELLFDVAQQRIVNADDVTPPPER